MEEEEEEEEKVPEGEGQGGSTSGLRVGGGKDGPRGIRERLRWGEGRGSTGSANIPQKGQRGRQAQRTGEWCMCFGVSVCALDSSSSAAVITII